jgi:hypothetical protein
MGQFLGHAGASGIIPAKRAYDCLSAWGDDIIKNINLIINHHKKALTDEA